jgi:hypothetical protein
VRVYGPPINAKAPRGEGLGGWGFIRAEPLQTGILQVR